MSNSNSTDKLKIVDIESAEMRQALQKVAVQTQVVVIVGPDIDKSYKVNYPHPEILILSTVSLSRLLKVRWKAGKMGRG